MCLLSPVVYIHNGFHVTFCLGVNNFAWVAHLWNSRRGCFLINTRKSSIITEQIKVPVKRNFDHTKGKPPFSYLYCFPDFPKKWVGPLALKSDQFRCGCFSFLLLVDMMLSAICKEFLMVAYKQIHLFFTVLKLLVQKQVCEMIKDKQTQWKAG